MTETSSSSYVVRSVEDIPLHFRDRAPFTLPNTEMILRRAENEILDDSGRVLMASAIEFQTQVTPGVLTDICDPEEIYKPEMRSTHRFRSVYDPEIQRGVKDTSSGPKEFLRPSEIEAMTKDIADGQFECPQLMWNLRAEETAWVYIRDTHELRVYEGVATRPDTNHRHHAIVRVHRRYQQWMRETGSMEMGTYNPQRAYGLVIYTDDFSGEGRRFYVYNFLGWRVSTSTAHYIESKTKGPNVYALLARELMQQSPILGASNVEVLSNHLSRNSAKMVTFGTLVDALKSGFPDLTEDTYSATHGFMLEYLETLGAVRPNELALLSVAKRQRVREESVADQAVVWHAYVRLAARLRAEKQDPKEVLGVLAQTYKYTDTTKGVTLWEGDLFKRTNPMWSIAEVVAMGKNGLRVVNNRQSRQGAFEFLCSVVGVTPRPAVVVSHQTVDAPSVNAVA